MLVDRARYVEYREAREAIRRIYAGRVQATPDQLTALKRKAFDLHSQLFYGCRTITPNSADVLHPCAPWPRQSDELHARLAEASHYSEMLCPI